MTARLLERCLTAAERHSGAPAVISREGQITYGDLLSQITRLAGALVQHGDHPRVLLCAPKGAGAYAGMLATLMAGGYYAPLDLEGAAQRQRLIQERFQPDVILVDGPQGRRALEAMGPLPEGAAVLSTAVLSTGTETPLTSPRTPHPLAYVMFTSGSTGVPKGVMVGQRALATFTDWAIDRLPLGPGARMSQFPNLGFDMSALDIYAALSTGTALAPITGLRDRFAPAMAIEDLRLTIWESVPSAVDLMRKARHVTAEKLASLDLLYFCGEALLPSQVEALFTARPDVEVINAYGPTEATISCSFAALDDQNWRQHADTTMSIGAPLPGMELRLVGGDHADEGELVLTGPQLAEGYWQDDERTAQAFANQPDGVRGYHTGDFVERSGGRLFFRHRLDRQVKVRGHRLELGEVDAALRAAGCLAARSVLRDGAIISFVEGDLPLPASELRAALKDTLASYAIPAEIRRLDALPRNANDKIDDRQLDGLARDQENG